MFLLVEVVMNKFKKHKEPDINQKHINLMLLKTHINLKGLSETFWTLLFYIKEKRLLINVKRKLALLLQV